MNVGEMIGNINFFAVLVSAFSAFFIGWMWYGPLFGKLWMKLNGFSADNIQEGTMPMPVIMGVNYVATFLAAFAIALFVGSEANIGYGIFAGVMIAIFWIATSRLNDVLYEKKPWGLFFINVGYNLVIYAIMGAIIGAWH